MLGMLPRSVSAASSKFVNLEHTTHRIAHYHASSQATRNTIAVSEYYTATHTFNIINYRHGRHGRVSRATTLRSLGVAANNVPRLNAAEQRELQGRMEQKQMKDFMHVRSPRTLLPTTPVPETDIPRRCTPTLSNAASTTA